MPIYTYRREDGSTFEIKQSFADEPLTIDPNTGQRVTRIVQSAGIIFKGSGFYVTDNKGAANGNGRSSKAPDNGNGANGADNKTNGHSEAKPEAKAVEPA